MTSPYQRARSDSAKQERSRSILDGAEKLASASSVRAVTLTQIAAEAGLHKSGLLRYFESREHIFLVLAAEHWAEWSAEFRSTIAVMSAPAEVAAAFCESLLARPLFCDLLAQIPMNLERNVSVEAVRDYKLCSKREVDLISADLHAKLGLTPEQGLDLIATATGLVGAFWQTASPRAEVARLFRDDPRLAHAASPIGARLERVLTAVLTAWSTGPAGD